MSGEYICQREHRLERIQRERDLRGYATQHTLTNPVEVLPFPIPGTMGEVSAAAAEDKKRGEDTAVAETICLGVRTNRGRTRATRNIIVRCRCCCAEFVVITCAR